MIRNIIIDANGFKINLEGFTDQEILAKTCWCENRGGSLTGMQSVLNVIMNRCNDDRWSDDPREVALQKWQFSCWNDGANPNRDKGIAVDNNDYLYSAALGLAKLALDDKLTDITLNSVYYFANGIATPSWATGHEPCVIIQNQRFFNDITN